ncbi:hypothetical protein IT575_01435 [bacterium]|nr:hypothetical protein [bacterium]
MPPKPAQPAPKDRRSGLLCLSMLLLICCACRPDAAWRQEEARGRGQLNSSGPAAPALSGRQLEALAAELQPPAAPKGVDPALMKKLTAELARLLRERAAGRLPSAPPSQVTSPLSDLRMEDESGRSYLRWSYSNSGDYNQDGRVTVNDLAPIGIHYLKQDSSPDWASAASAADGDKSGRVDIFDLSVIGINYLAECAGYNIYSSSDLGVSWNFVAGLPLESASQGFPRRFQYDITGLSFDTLTVAAYDFAGLDQRGENHAGSVGDPGPGSGEPAPAASVQPGSSSSDTSSSIPPSGGSLSGSAGGALEGVSVSFPPGALSGSATISLGTNSGVVEPRLGQWGGTLIELSTDGEDQFLEPVTITAPYPGGDVLPIPYYIDEGGALQLCDLTALDPAAGTFSFSTWHASLYTWILENLSEQDASGIADANFRPSRDGFKHVNNGSDYFAEGECLGFTAFAQWYRRQITGAGPFLYPTFNLTIGSRTSGQIITTRAYAALTNVWARNSGSFAGSFTLGDYQQYALIRNAIANTGSSVVLYIYSNFTSSDTDPPVHSISAYKVQNGVVWVYDPNYPGDNTRGFLLAGEPGDYDFALYDDVYEEIRYQGDGSLYTREPFGAILQDAEADFGGSNNAQISITSHSSGAQISERNPTISGTVSSGDVLIERVKVLVNEIPIVVTPDLLGNFSFKAPLYGGPNYLEFVPYWRKPDKGFVVAWYEDPGKFELQTDVSGAALLVTLTWDTANTDLDLYVKDPSGWWTWHSDKLNDVSGMELDLDDTDGYGPEHVTLEYTDQVDYGEPYEVWLHYYDGSFPLKYTATVQLMEGTATRRVQTFEGFISESNPGNDSPGEGGPDWAMIGAFTPLQ